MAVQQQAVFVDRYAHAPVLEWLRILPLFERISLAVQDRLVKMLRAARATTKKNNPRTFL
jgi:hypothetical protein